MHIQVKFGKRGRITFISNIKMHRTKKKAF